MRLSAPVGFSDWWDRGLPQGWLTLGIQWGSYAIKLGRLHNNRMLFEFNPDLVNFTEGAERPTRLLAKAFTRAGWVRPVLDPAALVRLLELRQSCERLEFILDTNALVEGVAHWLVDHFADRCDLVITAVTLRELQDANNRAGWTTSLDPSVTKKPQDRGKILGARQLYLAAHRLRERASSPRVLWRELEVDDTALLLSRGSSGEKSSESDTLLLRAVRRSIHDRVNNLERFFVTGDTALARRAATELPRGSVIAAQVRELRERETLFPCAWWPGPDQGLRVVRHPARLAWELLAVGEQVNLVADDERRWEIRAFGNPMWPSDYLEPWVEVIERLPDAANGSADRAVDPEPVTESNIPAVAARTEASSGNATATDAEPTDFWYTFEEAERLDDNLRLPSRAVMDLLASLALGSEPSIAVPSSVYETSASKHQVGRFLAGTDLASLDESGLEMRPGPAAGRLREAWAENDLDGIFDVVRRWAVLDEWATEDKPPKRPDNTCQVARALAGLLGQGLYHPATKKWVRGGRRPSVADMRAAVLSAVPESSLRAIPIARLLIDVFLVGLGVSPARVLARWEDLWSAGVFEDFEAREGGTSGSTRQEVAEFSYEGWRTRRIDLESIGGIRDLVYRGRP